jgi:hypothetical protein
VHAWLADVSRKLGVELTGDEQRALLELARVAAHTSGDRRNAPLVTYLVGLARGRGEPRTHAPLPAQKAGDLDVAYRALDHLVHARVDAAERELAAAQPPFELRQHRARVGAGQRPRLRHRDLRAEQAQRLGADVGAVDRQDHAHVVRRCAQAGDDAGDRRAHVAAVVDDGERQLERVRGLANCDPLVARLAEHAPRTRGERLAADDRERLRRAEPATRAPDEQHARQASIRHGSV